MEDYQIRHYLWEFAKVFCPVLITAGAMWFIDWQNKKRWLKDGYIKRKASIEIEIRQILLNIKRQLDLFPDLQELERIKNNLNDNDLLNINKINNIISETIGEMKEYKRASGFLMDTGRLKDEYTIESLLDEYLIFSNNPKIVDDFQISYKTFIKTNVLYSKVEPDALGNNSSIGIVGNEFNSRLSEIEILITNVYNFKNQTETLLKIIEANFEITLR
jgi:hypothetical protein